MTCVIKAIADPARQIILRSLHEGGLSLEALERAGLDPEVDLAHHLRVLRRAGLLREQPDQREARYVLDYERLHDLAAFLQAVVEEP